MRLLVLFVVVFMTSCGGGGNSESSDSVLDDCTPLYEAKYAKGFELYEYGQSTIVNIRNPWQGAENVNKMIFLSRGGDQAPEDFDGEQLNVPLKRVVCMSSSYVSFIGVIGEHEAIKGISGAKFISDSITVKNIAEGKVAEVGYDNSLNYELIVDLKPDAVFIYGVNGENASVLGKLKELGIKVVYIGEYLEESALAKAEWLVAFGEFFDKREQAATIFDTIAAQYNSAKKLTEGVAKRPKIMLNAPWRDSWFVPGDRSYMVRLIEDAAGEYVCAGTDSEQSRPISIENAYLYASKADIWLNPGTATTLDELRGLNPRFNDIKVVREQAVYNNNARTTPNGGSDFWESGVVSPHLILRDMIAIMHPELMPNHNLYYFHKLK